MSSFAYISLFGARANAGTYGHGLLQLTRSVVASPIASRYKWHKRR